MSSPLNENFNLTYTSFSPMLSEPQEFVGDPDSLEGIIRKYASESSSSSSELRSVKKVRASVQLPPAPKIMNAVQHTFSRQPASDEDRPVGLSEEEDVPVGMSEQQDYDDLPIGTEEFNWSISIDEPKNEQTDLTLEQIAKLLSEFTTGKETELEFIMSLFSKTQPQQVLFAAAISNAYSFIPTILRVDHRLIAAVDQNGNTALHIAIAHHSVGAIVQLLDIGANLFTANKMGVLAYEMMKHEKMFDAMRQFRELSPQH